MAGKSTAAIAPGNHIDKYSCTSTMSVNGKEVPDAVLVEEPGWMRAVEVILSSCSLGMALKGAIGLQVLEILADAGDHQLSARDIVARMQSSQSKFRPSMEVSNPTAHVALDRILRLLASHEVLSSSCTVQYVEEETEEGQMAPERKYGLTAAGRYFASGPHGAPSFAALAVMNQHRAFVDAWDYLEEAVLKGGVPFNLAHGKTMFGFGQDDPSFAALFNKGMASQSKLFMPFLLRAYPAFMAVKVLVDVGGGIGGCISAIVSKYPHVKGINFDQPHVVASAPSHEGVEHVGGDMFKGVPKGDAILMKWILHDWSDEQCVKILKNCYDALQTEEEGCGGKVIVVDAVLDEQVRATPKARANYGLDLLMLAYMQGGEERSLRQFEALARAAGFSSVRLVTQVNEFHIIEFLK